MSSLQDVSFSEEDDLEATKRKLRILLDEVVSLSKHVAQLPSITEGVLAIGEATADAGAAPPVTALQFIHITVNGVDARLAVYSP